MSLQSDLKIYLWELKKEEKSYAEMVTKFLIVIWRMSFEGLLKPIYKSDSCRIQYQRQYGKWVIMAGVQYKIFVLP